MANLYELRMRDIQHDPTIAEKQLNARDSVAAWIEEATEKMKSNGLFTPTEIADIMWQWFNASIRSIMDGKLPNEEYPLYKEVDSVLDGFLLKGRHYNLCENGGSIQIFGEDRNLRVKPAEIVVRNDIIHMRLRDPSVTLYFKLRDDYEEHHLIYGLYRILQNLY